MSPPVVGRQYRVRGLVQGVGMRPTVYRLAMLCGLAGDVLNDGDGVLVRAWGLPEALERFVAALASEAPPLARIDAIETSPLAEPPPHTDFRIRASSAGAVRTGVTPDAATCPACRAELFDPLDRRTHYPFGNCTHCGPRFTILRAIPYDRAQTSMSAFPMCPACRAEYVSPLDRRYHAQPTACPACGPRLWLEDGQGAPLAIEDAAGTIARTAQLLRAGHVLAIKGLGGFHLAVDAGNDEAIAALRRRKHRPHKPLALMARDRAQLERHVRVSDAEWTQLAAPGAPILLLEWRRDGTSLPDVLAPDQSSLGFMLPATPLHHLLMAELDAPIVLTSGNRSSEPPATDNADARTRLAGIADFFLMHDRDIVNRADDSVVRLDGGERQTLRRARGFAPAPLPLPPGFADTPAVLALGADLKNTFCLTGENRAIVSQHIGDVAEPLAADDLSRNVALYAQLFEHRPALIACDLHPAYVSARLARALAIEQGVPLVEVAHHHAHVAAVLGEHGIGADTPPVLGITLDGLGYGADDTLWGGELLLADYRRCERLGQFRAAPLLGGERAMREPWRNLYAQLMLAGLPPEETLRTLPQVGALARLTSKPLAVIEAMRTRGLNAPLASSAGRLFDACAAALEIDFDAISYEGQAAMALEALAASWQGEAKAYPFSLRQQQRLVIDWAPLWPQLLADINAGRERALIARRFHQTLADALLAATLALARSHSFTMVVLAGGVMQNRLLLRETRRALAAAGFQVLAPQDYPAGDGAISLGQALVTALGGGRR